MSMRLVPTTAQTERNPVIDFWVTVACAPYTAAFVATDLFFIFAGVPSRGARATVSVERFFGGRTVITGRFGKQ